jgi:hypothetical protein
MKPSPKKLKETKNIYYTVVEHLIEEGYATDSDSADSIISGMSDEWFETIVEGDNYNKNRRRAAQRAAERNAARDRGETGNVPGVGYVTSRREGETYRDSDGVERHTSGARMPKKDKDGKEDN